MKSTAILFGRYDIQIISLLQAVQCTFNWYGIVVRKFTDSVWFERHYWLWLQTFIYQWSKTKDKDPQRCFWAFRHNRWVGLIIFVGIVLALM